jgi:DNA-binding transcriptional ArsR family regulator
MALHNGADSQDISMKLTRYADMHANAETASALLKALANSQRLRILCVLAEGEQTVGQLNETVDLSQSALSQHLARLRALGLVATRREGQLIHYRLVDGPVRRLIDTLHSIYCATAPSRDGPRRSPSGRARSAPSRGT